ncbi:hypothetical protein CWIS_09740 [Cellulomonas sp. A375-1]|uniref:hypothetical protein n=1 Tax=Cellulomonas sp. A375-1 TaxID=1672219 RepID=UPI00065278D9|nr:hypothetical protein [Cellulomonas sp. A375-1]KMM45612.1 hypothetical protein CWIS_09740 [Cellulomonas sp. A375-1]
MTSITHGTTVTTPDLVLGYETSVEKPIRRHPIIGGGLAVTLASTEPRSGTLHLLYVAEADAVAAFYLLQQPGSFDLDDDQRPHISMSFVAERARLRLEQGRWIVEADYLEVIT